MTAKLKDEDGRAIDLLLNRPGVLAGNGNGNGKSHQPPAAFGMLSAQFQHRLQAAEQILNTFGAMRAGDPPTDLVQRTLRKIEETDATHRAPSTTSSDRPRHQPRAGA